MLPGKTGPGKKKRQKMKRSSICISSMFAFLAKFIKKCLPFSNFLANFISIGRCWCVWVLFHQKACQRDKARNPPKTHDKLFVCLGWSPQVLLTGHGACGKASLIPRNLSILFLGTFLGTLRKSTSETTSTHFLELLLSAVLNHGNRYLFQGTFWRIPTSFQMFAETITSHNCSA